MQEELIDKLLQKTLELYAEQYNLEIIKEEEE